MFHFLRPSRLFAFISDIHLERWSKNTYTYPIFNSFKTRGIFLAGDIGWPSMPNYARFLEYCAFEFPKVFIIAGNHEYDRYKLSDYWIVEETIREIVAKIPNKNVVFLQNEKYELCENYSILGSTLWSERVNSDLHEKSVEWLKSEIEEERKNNREVIILTHHVPTRLLIEPHYVNNYKNYRNFYSNLEYLIKPPVAHWICGHSHSIQEKICNSVTLHMNCDLKGKEVKYLELPPITTR
jgi:predicted MPP superfamily phosphohydrolase